MLLTVHLFTETGSDPAALLLGADAVDVKRSYPQPRLALDFECVAVSVFREHRRPAWAGYVDEYFDVDWQRSVTSSMVLLVRAAERWFATRQRTTGRISRSSTRSCRWRSMMRRWANWMPSSCGG